MNPIHHLPSPSVQEKSCNWWTGAVRFFRDVQTTISISVVILKLLSYVCDTHGKPSYQWPAMSFFCYTSRGFWGPSSPCGRPGWSLQMGLLHMGQTLRISSHFTRHLRRRQGKKWENERGDHYALLSRLKDNNIYALWSCHKLKLSRGHGIHFKA